MSSIVVNMVFVWVTECTRAFHNSTVRGLQAPIDICTIYAGKWKFNFGIKKSQCMSVGYKPDCFVTEHIWHLHDNIKGTVTKLEILDTTFTNNGACSDPVQNRIQKCRRAFCSVSNIGMNYTKSHLYNSKCLLTLFYGMQSVNLSSS